MEVWMLKDVVDIACGGRMFWFDRKNPRVVFCDKRKEQYILKDKSSSSGYRTLNIDPDCQVDFTDLPFPSDYYSLVVFDPPHLIGNGSSGWLAKKYGKLNKDFREDLKKGFLEGFRILKPKGVLIFKWNETDIPISEVLKLTDEKPLFGNRCGKRSATHWVVFMKFCPRQN